MSTNTFAAIANLCISIIAGTAVVIWPDAVIAKAIFAFSLVLLLIAVVLWAVANLEVSGVKLVRRSALSLLLEKRDELGGDWRTKAIFLKIIAKQSLTNIKITRLRHGYRTQLHSLQRLNAGEHFDIQMARYQEGIDRTQISQTLFMVPGPDLKLAARNNLGFYEDMLIVSAAETHPSVIRFRIWVEEDQTLRVQKLP
jgi:hypothetical protein